MSVNSGNAVMGPCTIYVGAPGVVTAMPADSAVNSTPAASAWTDLGGTNGGVSIDVTPKFTPLAFDQVLDDVDDRMTSRVISVTVNFAEPTLNVLALAINSTPGATGSGYATLEPLYANINATQTTKVSLLIDGLAPPDESGSLLTNPRRRLYLPKVQQIGSVKLDFARDKQQVVAVQFKAYYVSNTVAPFHVVDQQS